jgi:hypothetical protein
MNESNQGTNDRTTHGHPNRQTTMPSDLTKSVRSAIHAFVSSKASDGEALPADVLRLIRDEAALLLERQLICDMLDADPYKLCDDGDGVRRQLGRLQGLMNVTSCSRTKTMEGSVTIHCVVELSRDSKMAAHVKECVRLDFTYDRSPITYMDAKEAANDDDNNNTGDDCDTSMITSGPAGDVHRGTRIKYSIDFSFDHGPKERLITIEVMASGEAPSSEKAIPMEDEGDGDEEDVWEDFDERGESVQKEEADDIVEKMDEDEASHKNDGKTHDGASQATGGGAVLTADAKDRYAAYVDPEELYKFLSCTGLVFDEATSIYFLMTFPFFEHEWDLLGFLLDAVFGDQSDDESNGGGDNEIKKAPNVGDKEEGSDFDDDDDDL